MPLAASSLSFVSSPSFHDRLLGSSPVRTLQEDLPLAARSYHFAIRTGVLSASRPADVSLSSCRPPSLRRSIQPYATRRFKSLSPTATFILANDRHSWV